VEITPTLSVGLVHPETLCHDDLAVRIKDFLNMVYDGLPDQLPKQLREHDWRVRWSLLQVYFEKPSIHYEVWVQRKARRIELGLHFECERDESYRWAELMAPRSIEIQAQLGQYVELEEWTKSWTRLHETIHMETDLNESLAAEVAQRLARYIEVLEPILRKERTAIAG
jgi:hypothetical protein